MPTRHGEGRGSLIDEVEARGLQLGGRSQIPPAGAAILHQPPLGGEE